jgi:4-methyl-5(b-hydroxyethyl)-thiazole monophosphate biosynthesis
MHMSKVNVYLADGFEEVEGLTVVDLLRRAGIETDMVSIMGRKEITGARKIPVLADKLFEEQDDPDMIVLPGGMPGTLHLKAHEGLADLIRKADKEGKVLAAICAAPTVLEQYGMLEGRKATSYPAMEEELKSADYQTEKVVVDGKIITSRGMGTAIDFAAKLVELLKGTKEKDELLESIVYGE